MRILVWQIIERYFSSLVQNKNCITLPSKSKIVKVVVIGINFLQSPFYFLTRPIFPSFTAQVTHLLGTIKVYIIIFRKGCTRSRPRLRDGKRLPLKFCPTLKRYHSLTMLSYNISVRDWILKRCAKNYSLVHTADFS